MAGLYSQQFIRAINFVLSPSAEGNGNVSMDPKDSGNWTGGAAGKGELKGTKWGIAAADFPQLDIPALKREDAVGIYYRKYWSTIQGDNLPQRLAICVLDCAVNQGAGTAIELLQKALGMAVADGAMGPQTIAAVRSQEQDYLIQRFLTKRALRYAQSKQLATYGDSWLSRCFAVCMEASR